MASIVTWIQKYFPNLLVAAIRGWCLKYIDDGGKAPTRRPNATAAYEAEKRSKRIRTGTPPVNIWVIGFLSLGANKLGHAFYMKYKGKGKYDIRDSESRSGARSKYTSIKSVLDWFKNYSPKYLGWSPNTDGRQYAVSKSKSVPKKKTDTQIAKEVIAGKWGNGPARVAKLKKAGYNPVAVQKIVNKLI